LEEHQILQAVQAEVKSLKDANLRLKNNKKDGEKDKSKLNKKQRQKEKKEKRSRPTGIRNPSGNSTHPSRRSSSRR